MNNRPSAFLNALFEEGSRIELCEYLAKYYHLHMDIRDVMVNADYNSPVNVVYEIQKILDGEKS